MAIMRILDKIFKKIIKRYLGFIIKETRQFNKNNAQKLFNAITDKGEDSFFWGEKLVISDTSKVKIGKNVHIGDNAYIKSEGGLTIGDNTHISRNLLLYTVNHNYKSDVLPYNEEMLHKKVVIGQNVWIGMNVCVAPGTIIGDGCIIGMGTVVSGEIPALSIIGSQKWKVLDKRDEERYNEVVEKKRFGKENGLLYRCDGKILSGIGDSYVNERTLIEVIDFDGKPAIKKSWINNDIALHAFKNEKEQYKRFKTYPWLPNLYQIGENYLITEYIENEFRLDQIDMSLKTEIERNKILGDIMVCILDLFGTHSAHRDMHSKNIFLTPKGIKIIDLETVHPIDNQVGFFDSYDITAKGLESPYTTKHCCVLSEENYSLKRIFQIKSLDDLKQRFESYLLEELYNISNTFFTRKNAVDSRHTLRNRYIYATFDLEFLKVNKSIGQRDIKQRFGKFRIQEDTIKGKNVLDIGSNIGAVLFEVVKMQPKSALGLEYDENKVKISNTIRNLHYKNYDFVYETCDVESSLFLEGFTKKFEVVFCLAVVAHLKNKDAFIKKLGEVCDGTLYFEGNAGTDTNYIKEKLSEAGFSSVEYIGLSDDEKNKNNNNRPLFIAKK